MRTICRRAASLVELVVVISLIGMLIGLLLPAVQQVRAAASRTACQSRMRQVGLAIHHYESVRGEMPRGYGDPRPRNPPTIGGSLSWRVFLLPYLEREHQWRQVVEAWDQTWITYANPPHSVMSEVIREYICPTDGRLGSPIHDPKSGMTAGFTSLVGVGGGSPPQGGRYRAQDWGVFGGARLNHGTRFAEITDGLSNTLAAGERPPPDSLYTGWWYSAQCNPPLTGNECRSPTPSLSIQHPETTSTTVGICRGPIFFGPGRTANQCDMNKFWSLHPDGANFLFCDGAVRFMSYSGKHILHPLATYAGGEPGPFFDP